MQLHGNEWNEVECYFVKFMVPNEVRCHNMMLKLYETNVMSWNVVATDDCILQQSFGYIPRFDILKHIYKIYKNGVHFNDLFLPII